MKMPPAPQPGEPVDNYIIRVKYQTTLKGAQEMARTLSDMFGREHVHLTKALEEVA